MSLKTFHIVFVTVSTLLCVFIAAWAFLLAPEPGPAATAFGIVGVIGAIVMPVYGVLFYRKAVRIHL
jgi:multidrug transporter EmrE-like cation transporter